MKLKIYLALMAGYIVLMHVPAIAHACAVCWSGEGDPSADGFNSSVLFLMATPYLVVGSIVGGLVCSYRRAAAKREQNETQAPVVQLAWNEKESGR